MNVKSLEVERVDSLDSMSLVDVSVFLDDNSEKHCIECRNWADEFPYHPITAFAMHILRAICMLIFLSVAIICAL